MSETEASKRRPIAPSEIRVSRKVGEVVVSGVARLRSGAAFSIYDIEVTGSGTVWGVDGIHGQTRAEIVVGELVDRMMTEVGGAS